MTTLAAPSNGENPGKWDRFETSCADLITVLASATKERRRNNFGETLSAINSTLFGLAWSFLGNVPNRARRHELAREAVQVWHHNMLAKGFRSYHLFGEGRPFVPFAKQSMHNICVSLMRQLNRHRRSLRSITLRIAAMISAKPPTGVNWSTIAVRSLKRCRPDNESACG